MSRARAQQRARNALRAQRELLTRELSPQPRLDPAPEPTGLSANPAATAGPARACLDAVLDGLDAGVSPDRDALRVAVRFLLDALVSEEPGASVEVRVPPYAAVQCIAGPRHTRGTPANVVETDPQTWLWLATGRLGWHHAVADARVHASGERSDLSPYLPLRAAS